MVAVRTTDATGAPVRLTGDASAPDPAHTDTADLFAGVWLSEPPPATLHAGDVVVRPHASTTDPALTDVEVLAAPPTTHTISPHLHSAISALLATSHGYDAEHRIDPDEITWAYTHGGALHIIEHPDGSVTFTKHHRENCPFITSRGTQECDEDCYFPHPADVDREPGR